MVLTTEIILLAILIVLLLVNTYLMFVKKSTFDFDIEGGMKNTNDSLVRFDRSLEKTDQDIKVEIQRSREETGRSAKSDREELAKNLSTFKQGIDQNSKFLNDLMKGEFQRFNLKQAELNAQSEKRIKEVKQTVELQLKEIREDNTKQLNEMRKTVDEKLQSTLEKRFAESFTLIGKRLEEVHKGLGEMQSLATNVGDLKKVMTNVKSRGVIGEYQLASLLEDLLTNEQYEKNVKTKVGSGAHVEFAIKMPNKNNLEKTLWLPIDAKFPKEDYEKLVDAYDDGDPELLERLRKNFKNAILKNAKDIKEKYIDPPNTTEYGLMFLPFESLYAEVLRTPGLFEEIQKKYKVTITGPTTLSALLNSLQMGFRTLAIEKRTSQVWDLLEVVKKEFGQFGTVLAKTKKKLQEASNVIDQASTRSRVIERKLNKVQDLSEKETLAIESGEIFDDIEDQQIEDPDNNNVKNLF